MNIKYLSNYGNAIIGTNIKQSSIHAGNIFNALNTTIDEFSKDQGEKNNLLKDVQVVQGSASRDDKVKSKNNLEAFLYRNVESIGSGVVASLLFELGKLLIF